MKTQQSAPPKLKTQLFSCAFFRHCTQTVLSPTAAASSSHAQPPAPPLQNDMSFPLKRQQQASSSSSSSSSSQSFTQWRFPLSNSPIHFAPPAPPPPPPPPKEPVSRPDPEADVRVSDVREIFHSAELKMSSGSESERLSGIHLLERALVRDPPAGEPECPAAVMTAVVAWGLRSGAATKAATKVLLALCLAEPNRRVAVEAGAVAAVVEAAAGEMEGAAAERAMAALELMCTVPEGAAAIKSHALAVPVMVAAMGRPSARERECAMSVLAVIYGGGGAAWGEDGERAPAEEVARAVELAMQGECSARGRRKGLRLLKALQDCDDGQEKTTVV